MKKCNLLVPLAGRGQRFVDQGFTLPKYLITARDKHLIDWSMSSIDTSQCNLIFCLRQDHINNFGVDEIFRKKFGNDIKIVSIDHITDGSVSTCLLAEQYINNDLPLFIYTVDVFFNPVFKPQHVFGNGNHIGGVILTFKSNNPAYSYAKTNQDGFVLSTAEKEVISTNACVGVYGFAQGSQFVQAAKVMIETNNRTKGEFYITPLYNTLNLMSSYFGTKTIEVDDMYIMGTPEEYNFFVTRVLNQFGSGKIALASDHSGYELKQQAIQALKAVGLDCVDFGCYINKDCDQFDYVSDAIKSIKNGICTHGIGFCASGQAVNIAANKTNGIRSGLIYDESSAEHSIKHNCCNFFSIPTNITSIETFKQYLRIWQTTHFEGGRHCTRIQKIENSYGRL